MTDKQIIEATRNYVKNSLVNAEPGHDWFHIERVCRLAKFINKKEKADMFIVEMAALLHDISDYKFSESGEDIKNIMDLLDDLDVDKKRKNMILEIIHHISFKGSGEKNKMKSPEGRIVQDADRLDALGAVGIARVFSFAGHKKNPYFDPSVRPQKNMKFKEYKKMKSPAINHFYEKLLLLKYQMNTKTARKIAEKRHKFMLAYLSKFLKEWHAEDIK